MVEHGEMPDSVETHRDALVDSISRWRGQLGRIESGPSTLWFGVAHSAVARVGALINLAVTELVPAWKPEKPPTVGELIGALEHEGKRLRAECVGRPGRLLRPTEVAVLNRLTKLRKSIAHMEETVATRPASQMGRLETPEVLQFLDVAEEFCGLTLIDELICREARRDNAVAKLKAMEQEAIDNVDNTPSRIAISVRSPREPLRGA